MRGLLRNCPVCGGLLTSPPGVPCPRCLQEEESAVARIDAFLKEGGAATLAAVTQATGVRAAVVRRLVRSGRVVLQEGRAQQCLLCGRPLQTGTRLCSECAQRASTTRRPGGSGPAVTRPAARGRGLHSQGPGEDGVGYVR